MKIFRRIIFIGILLFLVFCIYNRELTAKVVFQEWVQFKSGLVLRIEDLKLDLSKGRLEAYNVKLYSSDDYSDRLMFDVPEVILVCELPLLLKRRVHFMEMEVNIKELNIERNPDRKLNLIALRALKRQYTPEQLKQIPKDKWLKLQIDRLKLKIERVTYRENYRSGRFSEQHLDVNFQETFRNITDPESFFRSIAFKVLTNTAFESILGLDFMGLTGAAGVTFKSTKDFAGKAVKKTQEVITGTGGKALEVTGKTIKKTAEGVKEVITFPFKDGE